MDSSVKNLGIGLSYINSGWLTGLSLWIYTNLYGIPERMEELEEVVEHCEEKCEKIKVMSKDLARFKCEFSDVNMLCEKLQTDINRLNKELASKDKEIERLKEQSNIIISVLEDSDINVKNILLPKRKINDKGGRHNNKHRDKKCDTKPNLDDDLNYLLRHM